MGGVFTVAAPSTPLQAGYSLALSIPDDDKYMDDKTDILEGVGLGRQHTFVLPANKAPSEDMMAFMRLMQLQGGVCRVYAAGCRLQGSCSY